MKRTIIAIGGRMCSVPSMPAPAPRGKNKNTTAATIPLCLSEWWQCGKLRKGQTIVLASFGAGYTWGSVLVKWSADDARLA